MIRHRFIVRGLDDFRIFATIPVETQVITWEKWVRPPDWEELEALENYAQDALTRAIPLFRRCADSAKLIADATRSGPPDPFFEDIVWRENYARQVIHTFSEAVEDYRERSAERSKLLEVLLDTQQRCTGFVFEVNNSLLYPIQNKQMDELIAAGPIAADNLRTWREVARERDWRDHAALNRAGCDMFQSMVEIADLMCAAKDYLTSRAHALLSSDPLPDTPCPPGVPFAAYTVEFKDAVFNVVEGHAWLQEPLKKTEDEVKRELVKHLDKLPAATAREVLTATAAKLDMLPPQPPPPREPTEDEKRVVEIVTQMLVERGRNPKAPERIPVVEANPGHANHVREAEQRDQQAGRPPKVRTIKFNISPPRYLREAVERIRASPSKPRKAHWVGGHWRNQAWGVGHKERREKWIKPHIRGLGEAGAVVARVAVADEVVATQPDEPTYPTPPIVPLP